MQVLNRNGSQYNSLLRMHIYSYGSNKMLDWFDSVRAEGSLTLSRRSTEQHTVYACSNITITTMVARLRSSRIKSRSTTLNLFFNSRVNLLCFCWSERWGDDHTVLAFSHSSSMALTHKPSFIIKREERRIMILCRTKMTRERKPESTRHQLIPFTWTGKGLERRTRCFWDQ